ncbi:hypothetical protein ACO0SA_000525 [Hanseniaspora valbyensis]
MNSKTMKPNIEHTFHSDNSSDHLLNEEEEEETKKKTSKKTKSKYDSKNESSQQPNIKLPGIKQLLTKPDFSNQEVQEQEITSNQKFNTFSNSEKSEDDKVSIKSEKNEFVSPNRFKPYEENINVLQQPKLQQIQQQQQHIPPYAAAAYPYMNNQLAAFIPSFTMHPQYPFAQQPVNAIPQIPTSTNNNNNNSNNSNNNNTQQQVPILYNPQSINQLPNGGLIFSPLNNKETEKSEELNNNSNNNNNNKNGNIFALSLQQQHQQHMLQQMSAQQHMMQQMRTFIPPQQQMMFQQQTLQNFQQQQAATTITTIPMLNPEVINENDFTKLAASNTNTGVTKPYINKNNIVERKKKSLKYKKRYICEICAEKAGVIKKGPDGEVHFVDFDPRDPNIVNSKHGKSSIPFSFSTSGHLARHSRLHSGIKNHVCPVPLCGKKFGRRDNMRQHYKIHLKKSSDGFNSSGEQQDSSRSINQKNLGQQLALMSNNTIIQEKLTPQNTTTNNNSNNNNSSNSNSTLHDFSRDAQTLMILQAQQQNQIQQQFLQQQRQQQQQIVAAAQQNMALQAQLGLPYQPINFNALAQNTNMIHGYPYENKNNKNNNNNVIVSNTNENNGSINRKVNMQQPIQDNAENKTANDEEE